jgi:hypothetical protein
MLKHHQESDSYANDCSQTFENYKLSRYTDYKISGCCDVGTDCHFYFIEDEYKKVEIEEEKRKIREAGTTLEVSSLTNVRIAAD